MVHWFEIVQKEIIGPLENCRQHTLVLWPVLPHFRIFLREGLMGLVHYESRNTEEETQ